MNFWQEMKESRIIDLSAQLAFYFLFMFIPFILFTITLLSYLPIEAKNAIYIMTSHLPGQSSEMVENALREVLENKSSVILVIVLSIVSTSNGVHATVRALNQAYRTEEKRSFWRVRLISLLFTFLMMLAILVQIMMPVLGKTIIDAILVFIPISTEFIENFNIARWIIGFSVVFIIVLGLFCYGPNHKLKIKDVWIGAFLTSVGWQLVSSAFALYLSKFGQFNIAYGTLGTVIVLMLWFYFIGFMLLLGGEVNAISYRKKRIVNSKTN